MDKKVKIIGVDKEGIVKLDLLSDKINKNINIDKIFPNQDVDKDYVRELLDGVEVLFLFYNSDNKRGVQIVNAIDYMANERKVVSIGVNLSDKFDENEKTILSKEFRYSDKFLKIINMLSKYDTEEAIISIDITDIRQIFSKDSDIFYDYIEVGDNENTLSILEKVNSMVKSNNLNSSNKNQIICFEKNNDTNFNLENIYNIISSLELKECENIFMLSNSQDKNLIKIGVIKN